MANFRWTPLQEGENYSSVDVAESKKSNFFFTELKFMSSASSYDTNTGRN